MTPHVAFISPVASDARIRKRIGCLEREGASALVLAFQRNYYRADPPPQTVLLGRVDHGNYLKRLAPLVKAIGEVRGRVKSADVVYAFGLDMLLLAWIALLGRRQRPRVVYEVADIRSILISSGPASKALRQLERFLLARTDLLVVTAPAYLEGYYRGFLQTELPPTQVIENKLAAGTGPEVAALQRREGPIRIGYFGLLRCRTTVGILHQLVRQYPEQFRVLLRGIDFGVGEALEELAAHPNVDFGGAYRYPDDLDEIYGAVDIVWVAQDYARANTMWSRTNRYYEACHFKKPMIAQVRTRDGERVAEHGLGACVDMTDPAATLRDLRALDWPAIQRWTGNVEALPRDSHTYTDEHARLLDALGFGTATAPSVSASACTETE